ncbi:MAG TPA: LrgB family protein [Magnetospirillum sp.]|jgi:predicted murein hydrolase (TIGR00659 family)|nr:LrgB family protein [Magnetospirillum sp.]
MPVDGVALFWPVATIGIYWGARALNQHLARWWTSPLLLTWGACLGLALALHASYGEYIRGTHWIMALLGPATVAFAMPIYERRAVIRRHWPTLLAGVAVGSAIAVGSGWGLATLLNLSPALRLSLLPRSVTTPFALAFSSDIGGIPELTATCVVITGLFGAAFGEILLKVLPLSSSFARGALFGMGAHGAGVAKAREVGREEGTVAGLVMVLAGLASVGIGPLLALWLR